MIIPNNKDLYFQQAMSIENSIVGMWGDVTYILHFGDFSDEGVQGDTVKNILKQTI